MAWLKLVLLPLLLLIFSAMFSLAVMAGDNSFDSSSGFDSSETYDVSGSQVLNGTSSELSMEDASFAVSMTLGSGVFAWAVSSVAFAGIFGIQVLGSGLAEVSVMALFRFASLYAIWLVFSVLASPLFLSIPLFGLPIYFGLTFFYSYGIIAGGSGMVGGG